MKPTTQQQERRRDSRRDNKTDADHRYERQRPSTHMHTHVRRCVWRYVDDRRPTALASVTRTGMASTRAQMQATPPRPPPASQVGVAAHDAIDTPSIHEHQRAASTHTHTCDDRTAAYPSRQEAPPQRAASTTSSRARAPPHMPSAGAATPRLSSRRDRRSHRSHATASDTPAPHRTPRQPGASGNPIVASVTR